MNDRFRFSVRGGEKNLVTTWQDAELGPKHHTASLNVRQSDKVAVPSYNHSSAGSSLTEGTDALQARCMDITGVAGEWREYDFNQQQETSREAVPTHLPLSLGTEGGQYCLLGKFLVVC